MKPDWFPDLSIHDGIFSNGRFISPHVLVVVVNHCSTSLFGTKGLLSDIISDDKNVVVS